VETRDQLIENGVRVIPTQQIIPDIYDNDRAYEFSPSDPNPNRAFNDLVAQYLAKEFAPQQCRQ
jgi:hypothetical protein